MLTPEQHVPERNKSIGNDVGDTKPKSREGIFRDNVLEHHDDLFALNRWLVFGSLPSLRCAE